MTAFVPYVTFMKHAQKVTKSASKSRPILSAVVHREDYVAVTDSHRLYKATGLYDGDEKQVDPVTGLDVDYGNYPEVERLISEESDAKYTHEIDVHSTYEAIRAIEIANRIDKTEFIQVNINGDFIAFKTVDGTAFDVLHTTGNDEKSGEEAFVSVKYMKEAIHVLKDAKIEKATLHYFGKLRPMQIHAGNFTAIVLPIRKTQGDD